MLNAAVGEGTGVTQLSRPRRGCRREAGESAEIGRRLGGGEGGGGRWIDRIEKSGREVKERH